MTDPLRHLVCKIRENDTSFSHKLLQSMMPLHFCHEIPQFPKYEYILPNSHCVLTQLVYIMTNGIISKLRCYCAQEHHFHSLIHTISALQINPICTMNFFLEILYVCNGGWILTVVRALINFQHLTYRHESCTKSKKNIYLDKSQKEIHITMQHIN